MSTEHLDLEAEQRVSLLALVSFVWARKFAQLTRTDRRIRPVRRSVLTARAAYIDRRDSPFPLLPARPARRLEPLLDRGAGDYEPLPQPDTGYSAVAKSDVNTLSAQPQHRGQFIR